MTYMVILQKLSQVNTGNTGPIGSRKGSSRIRAGPKLNLG